MASAGFDGNAAVGRYLEFTSNVGSNQSGFVVNVNSRIVAATIAVNTSATATFTIYDYTGVTETALGTFSVTTSRVGVNNSLNLTVLAGREIRIKLTSGSCSRPVVALFIVT